jgi:hypothetical protein
MDTEAGRDSKQSRESIFRQILVYPALAVAVIGAAPQYIQVFKAFERDLPVREVAAAEREHMLWVKNLECVGNMLLPDTALPDNTRVGARVCPSGDVLVKVKRVTGAESYRWLPLEDAKPQATVAALIGISTAEADELPATAVPLMEQTCQHWQNQAQGILVRRIRENNQCFEETLNTFTGRVVSKTPVACDAPCE